MESSKIQYLHLSLLTLFQYILAISEKALQVYNLNGDYLNKGCFYEKKIHMLGQLQSCKHSLNRLEQKLTPLSFCFFYNEWTVPNTAVPNIFINPLQYIANVL